MNTPQRYQVVHRQLEIPATVTLEIQAVDAAHIAPFSPGQFNMLYGFGAGEVPISFSGSPNARQSYRHTLRAVGKTSEALSQLQVGDQLGVRGPFGRGWPMDLLIGKHVLIIAGGLGLAPLRPVIETLVSQTDQYAGIQLFYGGKRPEELLYLSQFKTWRSAIDVEIIVDRAGPDWSGHIGVITQLVNTAHFPVSNTIALVCGPEIMMRFSVQTLQSKSLPDTAIYVSMERNMHCAIGHCGHCQWGPNFICKDGPVFCYDDIASWFYQKEL
ncbi:MAG: FAD/NAD(P)-binding protein [Gammaproteobacteria bacterium]